MSRVSTALTLLLATASHAFAPHAEGLQSTAPPWLGSYHRRRAAVVTHSGSRKVPNPPPSSPDDWFQGPGGDVSDEGVYWRPEDATYNFAPVLSEGCVNDDDDECAVLGDLWSVQGEVLAKNLPFEPSPDLSAEDVIVSLLRGLQHNDVPHVNAGLERCYQYSDLACKKLITGIGNGERSTPKRDAMTVTMRSWN